MSSYYYFASSSTFFNSTQNDQDTLPNPRNTISIPIVSSPEPPTPIPIHSSATAAAASKIQAFYRGSLLRRLIRRILAVDADAGRIEALIRRQDTVDAVRRDPRERIRVAEMLMALLLRLDEIPGFYPPVRELRREVARRVTALQEVLDAVVAAPAVGGAEGFPASWEEMVEAIGKEEEEEKAFECCKSFLFSV